MGVTASKATLNDGMKASILSCIREDDIVSMCCDLINIPSPTGSELAHGRIHARRLPKTRTHCHVATN